LRAYEFDGVGVIRLCFRRYNRKRANVGFPVLKKINCGGERSRRQNGMISLHIDHGLMTTFGIKFGERFSHTVCAALAFTACHDRHAA
jgi:hypothetical protein